jgi:hypothetical protein
MMHLNYCTNCGLKLNYWTIPITFVPGVSGGKVSCPNCLFVFPGMWTTCWNPSCDGYRFCRENNPIDEVSIFYLHQCPICEKTLLRHPMFGVGMEYDLAIKEKRDKWNDMKKNRPMEAENKPSTAEQSCGGDDERQR